jgi:hypothetical protein
LVAPHRGGAVVRESSPLGQQFRGHRREALRVTFYNKLNANERLVAIGAVIVIIAWLVGIASSFGFGTGTIPLLGAIAVLVVYYLKSSPTQSIAWPMPVQTIVLAIAAISALLALLGVLPLLGLLSAFADVPLLILSGVGTVVGAVIMAWGAWQDYQAMPKTTPPSA